MGLGTPLDSGDRGLGKWPFARDTDTEKMRRIAQFYRHELLETDPAACRRLDGWMFERGQGWLSENDDAQIDVNRIVSARQIYDEFGIPAWKVREWARRYPERIPQLKKNGRVLFRLGNVLDFESRHKKKNQYG